MGLRVSDAAESVITKEKAASLLALAVNSIMLLLTFFVCVSAAGVTSRPSRCGLVLVCVEGAAGTAAICCVALRSAALAA